MMRVLFFSLCINLMIVSCNNTGVQSPGAIPEQEKQLRELVLQYPDSLLLKENLIEYLRSNGNYEQAIKETSVVLNRDSLNARFLNIRATLFFENGDTVNAIKSFEKAVSIDPQPAYMMSLGSLYAQTKNPMALTTADALLRAPATNTPEQALFIKGLYYTYSGDKMKALSFFDSCIKINYRDVLAYREKAICLYDLNKYAAALEALNKAVAVKNTFEEGYYWMGRCYEKLNKRKEAINSYQSALQIDDSYIEAKEALERLGTKITN